MNASEKLPTVPKLEDLSFVRSVKNGRYFQTCYFHIEGAGDRNSDYELGVNKAVEYLDFLKAGGHFPLQFLIPDLMAAMSCKPWNGADAVYGFLHILNGCLSGGAKALQYREWSEQVIQDDRQQRANLDAWDKERKSEAAKRGAATRKANAARKREALTGGVSSVGGGHV